MSKIVAVQEFPRQSSDGSGSRPLDSNGDRLGVGLTATRASEGKIKTSDLVKVGTEGKQAAGRIESSVHG